ncbi:MAG: anhydro-N-acetylmuramic acid kinase [Flavobacteriales bacterium]|nr:anhydro-N-acetylmuramic acid kinase [Flavobacteriales bacterium]
MEQNIKSTNASRKLHRVNWDNIQKSKEYSVLGLMSGTSLDGLDMAICKFTYDGENWLGAILEADTVEYKPDLKQRLSESMILSALSLSLLDQELGLYMGEQSRKFLEKKRLNIDFIASHGHTVFHQPERSLTVQIGNPAAIAVHSGLPTVADFRRVDVAHGGQGAPLVPFGDLLLFAEYPNCLNLGGVANITLHASEQISAFDICPANMTLNYLAQKEGKEYDKGGQMASTGALNEGLLTELNSLPYFTKLAPKSLGREWFETEFLPLLENSGLSNRDLMRTCVEHIAIQISNSTRANEGKTLVTGGGAFNDFLIKRLRKLNTSEIHVPDNKMIQFKEAYVFAFLGLMRWFGANNTIPQVTGARKASSGGAVYLP